MRIVETDLNFIELLKTLSITSVVACLGLVWFFKIWLSNPLFNLKPDSSEPLFPKDRSFFGFLFARLIDLKNHDYWSLTVDFEGDLTSPRLPPLHPRPNHHHHQVQSPQPGPLLRLPPRPGLRLHRLQQKTHPYGR